MTILLLGIPIAVAMVMLFFASRGSRPGQAERPVDELKVYQDQLKEAEAQLKKGQISEEEFRELRPEIARRALAAAEGAGHSPDARASGAGRRLVLVAGAAAIMLSIAGYLYLGSPELPAAIPEIVAEDPAFAHGGEFSNLVAKLADRLKAQPDDTEGWRVYALTMAQLGRDSEAANFLGEAAEAHPDNVELKVLQAEALVRVADGLVVPAARQIFRQILNAAPDHPAGHYYLGLALFQDGDAEAAYRVWTQLRARSADDAPWLENLDLQIQRAQAALGTEKPQMPGMPALGDDQMSAIAQMTPEERRTFIESMIGRLRARLEEEPDDVDGWLRLARAESVMGRQGRAIEAMDRALAAAPDERKAEIEAMRQSIMSGSN